MNDNKQRDKEIYEARQKGETYTSIGRRYGISTERVRQICVKAEYNIKHKEHLNSDPLWHACLRVALCRDAASKVYNILRRNGFTSIEELKSTNLSDDDINNIRNVGPKIATFIRNIIEEDT